MSIIIDLRRRGFTTDQCWGLRKEPGFKKVLERGERWLQRSIARAESYLARTPSVRHRLEQMAAELIRIWPGSPDVLRVLLGNFEVAYKANRVTRLHRTVRSLAERVGLNYPAVMRGNRLLREAKPWRWLEQDPDWSKRKRHYDLKLPDHLDRALGIPSDQQDN